MESRSVRENICSIFAGSVRWLVALACLGMASAEAITITVKPVDGSLFNGGFRYTIEEDTTLDVIPEVTGLTGNPVTDPTLALAFHTSHTKIVKVGHSTGDTLDWTPPDASKRYYISVLPDNASFNDLTPTGYTMNGMPIRAVGGVFSNVAVPVNKLPFKTSQISIFVFEDNAPVNGSPDAPGDQEAALCGFEVQLFEAGGTYGASGGRVATDTFGNPLGTEYVLDANGAPTYNLDGSLAYSKLGANQLWTDRNGVVRIKNLSPAKYTLYSISPPNMPSVARCNFADANGNATNVPIWIPTEAARTRTDQVVWDNGFEIPPPVTGADQSKWHQTTTIEGTWGVDAWVKSGEPTFFKEFGPPGHHVWHGFVRRFKDTTALNGPATVTGKVVNTHMSRPPGVRFHSGAPMTACWVGINEVTGAGLGRTIFANACVNAPDTSKPLAQQDGTFQIQGLRAGQRYQLSVWDEPLDNVIANYEFVVPVDGSNVALNDVPVFSWFSNLQGKVFYDKEATGYLFDAAGAEKPGIPGSIVNIRFRDGSIYQSTVTNDAGEYEFPEVFPFFNWMVAETDFTRFKATGATIIADNGGPVEDPLARSAPTGLWPNATLSPQAQPENGGLPYRIFGGLDSLGQPVAPSSANLLQTMQGFLGQTNIIHWGKSEYNPADRNDHGGITGVVHYASTRSEFDPKFATAENNEPGVPSVEIRLYRLDSANKVIDPANPTGPRIEPKDANEAHAVQVVVSDDWNKAKPENCVDPQPYADRAGHSFATDPGHSQCYDGMRIWNQVRDGVFDGGWAFADYCPAGVTVLRDANNEYAGTECVGGGAPLPMPPGRYMTEGIAPYGYEHQKEEDKNVDFGDLLAPGTLANPAECIGSRSEGFTYNDAGVAVPIALDVPLELEAFAGVEIPERFRGTLTAPRPYCNKKLVVVAPGANPFSDFHMFAKAPIAGHIVGMILDDLANEFDPYAPSFGEKYAPPFMPVSIRDYAGNEINRVYSDRYGTYNAMVPSTFAYNVPMPSGVAPNMVNVCLNSPTMKDPVTGATVIDPHYNPQYTQYCYTFQYLPGKTTYLDTPVLPIAAFAGPSQFGLDTEQPDGTPGIKLVTGQAGLADVGPWVPAGGGPIRIVSMGTTRIDNPAYDKTAFDTALGTDPAPTQVPKTITRDFGFGAAGQVTIGGTAVAASSWANDVITVNVPAGVSGTVEVLRTDTNRKSIRGVTLHAGNTNMANGHTSPITVGQGAGYQFQTIQAAIDDVGTGNGDLITVAPGVYEEAPILWKRVRVQGYGAPVSIVNASMGADPVREQTWRTLACNLVLNQGMSAALITGQAVPANMAACITGDTVDNAPLLFAEEEASGFFVLQRPIAGGAAGAARGPFIATNPVHALQIDGFTVTGADTGGAIVANGNAAQLQISNNRLTGNQGLYNGGIRIGHADLTTGDLPVNANNLFVDIHHNEILKNGNTAGDTAGGGGGISIYTGSGGYRVAHNYVAGNFSTGDGGGMAHYGASGTVAFNVLNANAVGLINQDNRTTTTPNLTQTRLSFASTVSDNQFRFNQSFSQAKSAQGGGLAVVGVIDPIGTGITLGTGSMTIINNLFQGNLAGSGDGGGIALVGVNGSTDVANGNRANWNRVDILNNVIVNNGVGVAGGGISLQDAANVNIVNNTIALNDSYGTGSRAFQGSTNTTQAANCAQGLGAPGCLVISESVVQNGAGIAAYGHSPALLGRLAGFNLVQQALAGKARFFSDAQIVNSVVQANRSYHWKVDYSIDQTTCAYETANGNPCFGLIGPESNTRVGNDVAVLFAPPLSSLLGLDRPSVSYSVLGNTGGVDGLSNVAGDVSLPGVDFASAYANGSNGALRQLLISLEQSIVIGAPVLEVQEPTVATTAAAFDEGGNFIDVRFGPLTRGAGTAASWIDFGTYNPTALAAGLGGHFASGLSSVTTLWPKLGFDLNGNARSSGNFVRGALAQ